MDDIYKIIDSLILYAIDNNLIEEEDKIYIRNRLFTILNLKKPSNTVGNILNEISTWAIENKVINNSSISKQKLEGEIIDLFLDKPSNLIKEFFRLYKISPSKATEYFYNLSLTVNNVKLGEIQKNILFKCESDYGEIHLTINCTKPEILNKTICIGDNYPKCVLCKEMEGFDGNEIYPSRISHRIIPLLLSSGKWYMYYSPYAYFNEHVVIINDKHIPMKICKETFRDLMELVVMFPHYKFGSNADKEIVGGSILNHNHYQGGNYEFPIEKAEILEDFIVAGYEDLKISRLKWPLTVVRVVGKDMDKLCEFSEKLLKSWQQFDSLKCNILSHTQDGNHNTITPFCRMINGDLELNLALRNNRRSHQYPCGVFSPHEDVQNVKKENIGLIEVMGLAILPARLLDEMKLMEKYLKENDIKEKRKIESEIPTHKGLLEKLEKMDGEIENRVRNGVSEYFIMGLSHCRVFNEEMDGRDEFKRLLNNIK